MQSKKVIKEENIPTREEADKVAAKFRAQNPVKLSWLEQADGKFTVEAEFDGTAVSESNMDGRTLILE